MKQLSVTNLRLPMRRTLVVAVAALSTPVTAAVSNAQTAQPLSLHASAFATRLSFEDGSPASAGVGAEVQLRRTFSRFSIGVGAQFTQHDDLSSQLGGVMIEPRMVLDIGTSWMTPYLAVRTGYVRVLNLADVTVQGLDLGGGGGLIIPLGRRTNLDMGGALVQSLYRSTFNLNGSTINRRSNAVNYAAKIGLSVGL